MIEASVTVALLCSRYFLRTDGDFWSRDGLLPMPMIEFYLAKELLLLNRLLLPMLLPTLLPFGLTEFSRFCFFINMPSTNLCANVLSYSV